MITRDNRLLLVVTIKSKQLGVGLLVNNQIYDNSDKLDTDQNKFYTVTSKSLIFCRCTDSRIQL